MTEGSHGINRLRGKTSLKEILEVATSFEASARDFYAALAPKSNALLAGWTAVLESLGTGVTDPVPLQLRNAPTELMRAEGYGRGYEYAHDDPEAVTAMECLPAALAGRRFYRPTRRGVERLLARRLETWLARRHQRSSAPDAPPEGEQPR